MKKVNGYDDCILGVAERFCEDGTVRKFYIYSVSKMIELMMQDGMTDEEAVEYFEFNISGAYLGEDMPAFLYDGAYAEEIS